MVYIFKRGQAEADVRSRCVKAASLQPSGLDVTGAALRSAAVLGFGRSEIIQTIQTMERRHFYKIDDHLCRPSSLAGRLSRPLNRRRSLREVTAGLVAEFLLLSFKEKENG